MKWTAPASCPSCGHTERVDLEGDEDERPMAVMPTNPCVRCGKPLCAECQRFVPGVGLVCEGCRDLDEFAGVGVHGETPGPNGGSVSAVPDPMGMGHGRFESGTPASELRANWR